MKLIRLIQRASILAGLTLAILPVSSNPAQADEPQFCIVASNGKTMCGTLKAIERACVTTDGSNSICGKFKSVTQGQAQTEARNPSQSAVARKEIDGVSYLLRGCRKSGTDLKCNFVITTKKENKIGYIFTGKGSSSIVDSAGRTYASSNLDYNAASSSGFSIGLAPGVDYVVDVNFENLPGQLTQAALLNISSSKVIQFRNVPLSN